MVHNGIEYGLMQAYAEGFDILKNANIDALPAEHRFDLDIADIAEVWRRGSVIPSWLLDLTASALAEERHARQLFRLRRGFRRRPLDRQCRDRRGGAGRGADRGAVRALPLAPGTYLRRKDSLRHARRVSAATRSRSSIPIRRGRTRPTSSSQRPTARDRRPQSSQTRRSRIPAPSSSSASPAT